MVHDMKAVNDSEDKVQDNGINQSDFMPEPSSLNQILHLSPHNK